MELVPNALVERAVGPRCVSVQPPIARHWRQPFPRDVWSTADGQAWSLVTNDAVFPSHGLRATLWIVAYRAVGAMTMAVAPAILIFGPPKVSLWVGLALQSSPRKSNFCARLLSFCNFQFC